MMKLSYGLPIALLGAAVVIVHPQVVEALSPEEVNAIAKQITVRIDGANTGSGVIINRQGNTYTVLTNKHVVQTKGNYTIQTPDNRRYSINSSLAQPLSKEVDLAVLRFTSTENYRVAELGNSDQLSEGTTVYAGGWANPNAACLERCYLSPDGRIYGRISKAKEGYNLIFSNVIKAGMSGGPVLDTQGRLVAINGRAITDAGTGATDFFGISINTYKTLASAAITVPPQTIAQPAKPPQSRTSQLPQPTSPRLFTENPKELIDEVWQIISRQYVDGTFNQQDWQAVRREYLNKSYSNKQEAYNSIREMLKKLNDPYTRFMDPEEFKKMQVETSGELTGIGIQIGLEEKTKKLTIIAPIEDTPAFKAGILAKDIIIRINGKSTQGMDTDQAVSLIRGKPGTSVNLTIERSGQQKDYKIIRAKIEIHPVEYFQRQTPVGSVGYIRLKQFSANARKEMQTAIKNLEQKQVVGYILDLRNNPGGELFSCMEIARMWINNGTIVSTKNRQGVVEREVAKGRALTNKPLVVLVDKGSADASEILSGALQDNKRAVLVGSQTFGKGSQQSVRPLDDGSGIAVTTARYFTPSGRDMNKYGIAPDVKVELTDNQRQELWLKEREKIGTLAEPQFATAVEVLGRKISNR